MSDEPIPPAGASVNGGVPAAAAVMPIAAAAAPAAATPQFGRLESVPLRNYWQDEARDFTPWLARE